MTGVLDYKEDQPRFDNTFSDNFPDNHVVPAYADLLETLQERAFWHTMGKPYCNTAFNTYAGGDVLLRCFFHSDDCGSQSLAESQNLLLVTNHSFSSAVLETGYYTVQDGYLGSPDIFCHPRPRGKLFQWLPSSEFDAVYCPNSVDQNFRVLSPLSGKNIPIVNCMSQRVEHTTLNLSRDVLIIIAALGSFKLVIIFLALRLHDFEPILGVGDTIAHFLTNPPSGSQGPVLLRGGERKRPSGRSVSKLRLTVIMT
jgi:hypothetical protein